MTRDRMAGRVRFVARGQDDAVVRRSILRILQGNELCSIATVRPGGRPHINTAFFACSDDFDFYFLSNPRSVHCRNLAENPSTAMAIFSSAQKWVDPGTGLQLFGTCAEARGRWAARAAATYGQRFPAHVRWVAGVGTDQRGAKLLRSYRLYRFVPRKVKVLDESVFGGAVNVAAVVQRRIGR